MKRVDPSAAKPTAQSLVTGWCSDGIRGAKPTQIWGGDWSLRFESLQSKYLFPQIILWKKTNSVFQLSHGWITEFLMVLFNPCFCSEGPKLILDTYFISYHSILLFIQLLLVMMPLEQACLHDEKLMMICLSALYKELCVSVYRVFAMSEKHLVL